MNIIEGSDKYRSPGLPLEFTTMASIPKIIRVSKGDQFSSNGRLTGVWLLRRAEPVSHIRRWPNGETVLCLTWNHAYGTFEEQIHSRMRNFYENGAIEDDDYPGLKQGPLGDQVYSYRDNEETEGTYQLGRFLTIRLSFESRINTACVIKAMTCYPKYEHVKPTAWLFLHQNSTIPSLRTDVKWWLYNYACPPPYGLDLIPMLTKIRIHRLQGYDADCKERSSWNDLYARSKDSCLDRCESRFLLALCRCHVPSLFVLYQDQYQHVGLCNHSSSLDCERKMKENGVNRACRRECHADQADCLEEIYMIPTPPPWYTSQQRAIIKSDFAAKKLTDHFSAWIDVLSTSIRELTFMPKYSFIEFLSQIGGTLGLWYGFSFLSLLKIAAQRALRLLKIGFENLGKSPSDGQPKEKVSTTRDKISRLFPYGFALFCGAGSIYQLTELTIQYARRATVTNFELGLSLEQRIVIPAVTIEAQYMMSEDDQRTLMERYLQLLRANQLDCHRYSRDCGENRHWVNDLCNAR